MTEIITQYIERFIDAAEKELRQDGLSKEEIQLFSKSFRETSGEQFALARTLKDTDVSDIEEFIDDMLRLTISRMKDEKIKEVADNLWGLRAEQRLELLERKEKENPGDVIEFKKPR
jgi:hypothetical protein